MRFYKFKKALKKSWSQDTAYHKDAPNWTPDNPALGQCAISALLFNHFFGGKIYSGVSKSGVFHYWNKKWGIKIDLTKSQFSEKLDFKNVSLWMPEDLLSTGNVSERYSLLKSRFDYNYSKLYNK